MMHGCAGEAPEPAHERGRQNDEDDAQVLHQSDQGHVAAEGVGEQHHHRRRAGEGAPQGRAPGQDVQAGEHHTERCRDKQHRKRRADKEDEVLADGLEQGRGKIAGDEATNDRLREWEEPARQLQCCAAADKDHGRAHRAEKERRWQADQLEEGNKNGGGYQEERDREKGDVIYLIHF